MAMKDLSELLGGNIELLEETNISIADFTWNDKLWDYKNVSSHSSLDNAIRKGCKQIGENPGGLILNMDKSNLNAGETAWTILNRLKLIELNTLDVIFMKNHKIQKIMRYKK